MGGRRTATAPVLIVGGGPVGLGAAIALSRHGVPSVLVERRAETGHHPKARGFRIRTMELLRGWGLEAELRARAQPQEAFRFIYCDTLAGEELARTPDVTELLHRHSPSGPCRVPQDVAESALRARVVADEAVDARFGVACAALEEGRDEVVATLDDGRATSTLAARYAIAADGVASDVRRSLGIAMQGEPLIAYWQSIYWRGDVEALTAHRPCIQFLTGARSGRFVTVASVDRGRWVTMVMLPPAGSRPPAPDERESAALVRAAVGREELDVEVLDVATWRVSAQVAERFRAGRVFLAGDAAHALPPTGGFGMNTGLQDVHNLAWKLALVLEGAAGEALLDSYDAERRPVAVANARWSAGNARLMGEVREALAAGDADRLERVLDRQRLHVAALRQDLGFRYERGAVVGAQGGPAGDEREFAQEAAPGCRTPHVWLELSGRRISTLDLFDRRFVLLGGPAAGGWAAAAADAARELGVEVAVHRIGAGHAARDPNGDFLTTYGLEPDGAVLVRPDGHVAWRAASGAEDDAAERLADVLATLLARRRSGAG
jgi:putative polyketide hydroxylase